MRRVPLRLDLGGGQDQRQLQSAMITAPQNEGGGRALGSFYLYNRIIEKDRFLVCMGVSPGREHLGHWIYEVPEIRSSRWGPTSTRLSSGPTPSRCTAPARGVR